MSKIQQMETKNKINELLIEGVSTEWIEKVAHEQEIQERQDEGKQEHKIAHLITKYTHIQ